MKKYLAGQLITKLDTINSQYAQGFIQALDDKGVEYRLPVTTILQMLNDYIFVVEMKKKYQHLTEAIKLDDNGDVEEE